MVELKCKNCGSGLPSEPSVFGETADGMFARCPNCDELYKVPKVKVKPEPEPPVEQ